VHKIAVKAVLVLIVMVGIRVNGPAVAQTFNPVPWLNDASLRASSMIGQPVTDWVTQDKSNGGTSPQGYVNISSGVPDLTKPSAYFTSNGTSIFLRIRLESNPVAYSGGATASSTDPFSSAQWTLLIDYNGDGWRDFAIFLNGSSGNPSAPIDVIQVLYSTVKTTQSIDPALPGNHSLGTIYTGRPYASGPYAGKMEQFDGNANLISTNPWPNGKYTTVYDFGTTRMINQVATGGQYLIDYQIPISLLDARPFGGPLITSSTPVGMAFVTANSLNDPFQKDFSYLGGYNASSGSVFPDGDFVTPDGTTFAAPIVSSISATACPNVSLKTTILDAMRVLADGITVISTVSSVNFYYWSDMNGNGLADDAGTSWTLIGTGAAGPLGTWTRSWNTSSLPKGRYLIKVIATDEQGNVTDSYTENFPGGYANLTASINNTCGTAYPFLSKSVDKATVSATGSVAAWTLTYTMLISNPTTSAFTLASLSDQLPASFSFVANAGGSITPAGSPAGGATGTITWTFSPAVSIAAGRSDTLRFSALAGTTVGTYSNSASGTGSLPITPVLNTAPVVIADASVSLTKSISTLSALTPGQSFSYTLSYQNNGTMSLTTVAVLDTLAPGLTFVSASNGGTYNGATRVVSWSLGALGIGQSGSVTLNVSVSTPYTGSGSVRNSGTITASEISSPKISNTISSAVLAPSLSLQKSGTPSNLTPGMVPTYSLTYGNQGTASATGVTIVDTLPSTVTYVAGSSSPLTPVITTTGSPVQQILTWTVGSLTTGSAGNTITFQAVTASPYPTAGANQQVNNTAWISCNEVPPVSSTNSLLMTANPSVSLLKTADKISYSSTDTATFTLTLRNSGSVNASLSNLVDSLPPGFTYVSTAGGTLAPTSSPSAGASGAITWGFSPNATLLVGTSTTLVFKAKVSSVSNTYTNIATATGTLTGPSSSTISAQTSVLVSSGSEALQKSSNKLSAYPGDTLTFTLFYINTTGGNQNNRTIRDTLASNLTFVSQTATSNGGSVGFTQTGSALLWDPHNPVQNGDFTSVTLKVLVNNGVAGGTLITNRAWIGKGANPPQPSNLVTITVLAAPVFSLTKSVNRTSAPVNTSLVYTLSYSNAAGAGTATGTVVTDTIPSNLTYVSGTATGGGFYSSSPAPKGRLIWNLGSLSGGASGSFTFNATIDGGTPLNTIIPNTAQLTNNENFNKTASVNDTVKGLPNFTLAKSADRSLAGPGDTLTYTIQYSNTGTATATAVTIVDTLPANTTFVSADAGGTPGGGIVTWSLGSVNAGASSSRTLVLRINKPLATNSVAQVTNRAAIRCTEIAATSSNSVSTTVGYPLLSVGKSVDSTSILPNSVMTYTLTVSNASFVSSTGTVVTDAIPALCSYVSGSTTLNGAGVSDVGGTSPLVAGFSIGTVTVSQSATITFKVRVDASAANGAQISNSASVGSDRITGTSVSSPAITVVHSVPTLTISKTAALTGPAAPGSLITYTITYGNTGTAGADNLTIVDAIPSNTSYMPGSVSGTGASFDAIEDQILISRNSLAAGTVNQVVTFQVIVHSPLPGGNTTITNTVIASAANAGAVTSGASTLITAASQFSVSKNGPSNIALTGSPTPSASFTYTVNYTLSGDAVLDSVTLTDILPANILYVSSTLNGSPAGTANGQTVSWALGTLDPGTTGQATVTVHTTTPGAYSNTARITSRQDTIGVSGTAGLTTVHLSATGTIAQTPVIVPDQAVSVTVDDADVKGDGLLFVSIANSRTGETEQLGLNETALNSGVFTATISTTFGTVAGTSNDGFFVCQAGDTLRATYLDAARSDGTTGTATSFTRVIGGATATIAAVPVLIAAGSPTTFSIADRDLDHDTTIAESYSYAIHNSTGETENLLFTETGVNSGIFAATLPTLAGTTPGPNNDGSMTVQPGDTLRAVYLDSLTADGGSATISAFALIGSVNFSGSHKSVVDRNGGNAIPGDTLGYTITVKNLGSATATSVSVVDTLPSSVSAVAGSITGGGVLAGNIITFAPFNLPSNDSLLLTLNVIIDSTVIDQATVTNVARISANGVVQLVSASLTAMNRPVMVLAKIVDHYTPGVGDTVEYTITYSNIGVANAVNVSVTDTVPNHTAYVPNSVILNGAPKTDGSDGDEVSVAGVLITVSVSQHIAPGQTGTIKYRVKVQ
jgi:uncharacterized repeat protein (TIGR01451 family)